MHSDPFTDPIKAIIDVWNSGAIGKVPFIAIGLMYLASRYFIHLAEKETAILAKVKHTSFVTLENKYHSVVKTSEYKSESGLMEFATEVTTTLYFAKVKGGERDIQITKAQFERLLIDQHYIFTTTKDPEGNETLASFRPVTLVEAKGTTKPILGGFNLELIKERSATRPLARPHAPTTVDGATRTR